MDTINSIDHYYPIGIIGNHITADKGNKKSEVDYLVEKIEQECISIKFLGIDGKKISIEQVTRASWLGLINECRKVEVDRESLLDSTLKEYYRRFAELNLNYTGNKLKIELSKLDRENHENLLFIQSSLLQCKWLIGVYQKLMNQFFEEEKVVSNNKSFKNSGKNKNQKPHKNRRKNG